MYYNIDDCFLIISSNDLIFVYNVSISSKGSKWMYKYPFSIGVFNKFKITVKNRVNRQKNIEIKKVTADEKVCRRVI